jgi:hypothetical protein
MPEKVTIPIAVLEYEAVYLHPLLAALMNRATIVEAVYDALVPWNIDVDGIEVLTTGKPTEQGINFRLPDKKLTFFFGASACKLTWNSANWEDAEEIVRILSAALTALKGSSGAEFSTQKVAIAMHLQPKRLSFIDILKPILSPLVMALNEEKVTTGASVVRWGGSRVTIDGSGALANAIYLKIDEEFTGAIPLGDIAVQLRTAEEKVFKLLDVEEDL